MPPLVGRVEIGRIVLEPVLIPTQGQELQAFCRVEVYYPDLAIKARMQGTVILSGELTDGGHVRAVWVTRGVNPLLDQAALSGFREADFPLPLVPDGKGQFFSVPVSFRLY